MHIFFITAKYLIPVIAVLWLAQHSPLGQKNGTLVVALLLSICSLPQFLWLFMRLGRNMMFLRSAYAFRVVYEIFLLLVITVGLWVWLATL